MLAFPVTGSIITTSVLQYSNILQTSCMQYANLPYCDSSTTKQLHCGALQATTINQDVPYHCINCTFTGGCYWHTCILPFPHTVQSSHSNVICCLWLQSTTLMWVTCRREEGGIARARHLWGGGRICEEVAEYVGRKWVGRKGEGRMGTKNKGGGGGKEEEEGRRGRKRGRGRKVGDESMRVVIWQEIWKTHSGLWIIYNHVEGGATATDSRAWMLARTNDVYCTEAGNKHHTK